jgi:sugar phosphate isomerase/epimerase
MPHINTIRQVLEGIAPIVGTAKINIDLFHSWWDPDLASALRAPDLPLGLLQICDVKIPADPPFAHRVPPGQGILDLEGTIRRAAGHLAGRRAPVEVEVFSEQLGIYDFQGMLRDTRRVIHAAWTSHSADRGRQEGARAAPASGQA